MDRVDNSLIALRRIIRATELYGRDLKQIAGITAVQFRALQIIGEKGYATAKEVSTRMRVSQATVTSLVDKLVRENMVTREKSETDRRQTDICITEQGRDTLENAPDPLQQRFVRKFAAMEDWEQTMLQAMLERVASMMDAEDLDASPVLDTGDIKH
ncbi:MarR family transcriptional regulator [Sagittula sp. NFXS13]|uniref:DNA-binding MarR family transcriptional regulator n=1 Tax=Sagittula marina TaxID=943940 RepID=A0A7W6DN65_9RHOB|nr:MarR family transcriptional regulator [Sagittula marina]MBB3986226.1 DNA-binding MarR family transcriptional regulator [Sagittula marina]